MLQIKNEREMNAVSQHLQMRSLRRVCRDNLADRIHNEEIYRMVGKGEDITVIMKKNVK